MGRAADIAFSYVARDWSPLPIPTGRKCPNVKGWPELRIKIGQVETYFARDPLNIGILLGDASGRLVDVDLDCEEACAIAASILPSTNSVFGRRSKPTSHMLFTCKIESKAFKDPERGDTLLEIRSNGHQTVFPGSIHPSGESVEWYEDGPVAEISDFERNPHTGRLVGGADSALRRIRVRNSGCGSTTRKATFHRSGCPTQAAERRYSARLAIFTRAIWRPSCRQSD